MSDSIMFRYGVKINEVSVRKAGEKGLVSNNGYPRFKRWMLVESVYAAIPNELSIQKSLHGSAVLVVRMHQGLKFL